MKTSSSRALGAALALVAALSCGCAVIPVGNPAAVEESLGDPMTKPFVRMLAFPPQPDWTPEDVVDGLLAAMAAYPDDPKTLPEYLTQRARNEWKPAGPITVVEDGAAKASAEGNVQLTGKTIAQIEDDDRYVPIPGKPGRQFRMKKEAGGWRVDHLDNGLVMRAADVARAYRPTLLYYLTGEPRADALVSDAVHLRFKPGENIAETIVGRLVHGPSNALRGAVRTAVGGNVGVESITATTAKVVINLGGELELHDSGGLKAQLWASLKDVAAGREIEVVLNGEPFISAFRDDVTENLYPSTESPAYYTSGGAVYYTGTGQDGAGNPILGPAGQANGYTGAAISKFGERVAAVGGDGIYAVDVTAEGQWNRVMQGTFTAPSWHRDGSLWAYETRSGHVMRSDLSGAPPAPVAAPDLDGTDVTQLRVSRDGVRVAVGVGGQEVRVGAITGGGAELTLGNFQSLLSVDEDETVQDIAWRDGEHLLVLVKGKAGQTLKEIDVGDGETVTLTSDKRLKTIAALGKKIMAGTEDEAEVLEFKEQGWTSKVKGNVQAPLFPLG
ncbi:LpqB family beta-propeller domain-containing protein [Nonomuraea typhae]|uniref:LpqB family beta-propeller domain-containing protein n=1 Tax=Nonomuraea typhae TaxID=2603600 RepID=UPI0012FA8E8E|nr:LpqB family beta-propeller domain-containing protein [Nonomuraea typhae]